MRLVMRLFCLAPSRARPSSAGHARRAHARHRVPPPATTLRAMELDLFRGPGVALVTVLLFGVGLAQARPREPCCSRGRWSVSACFTPRGRLSRYRASSSPFARISSIGRPSTRTSRSCPCSRSSPSWRSSSSTTSPASPARLLPLRTWAISRGQLLIGALVILGQLVVVNRAVCPACVEVPWAAALAFIAAALAASLVQQFWRQRYDDARGLDAARPTRTLYERVLRMPRTLIRDISVVGFRPSRAAAPFGP